MHSYEVSVFVFSYLWMDFYENQFVEEHHPVTQVSWPSMVTLKRSQVVAPQEPP